MLYSLLAIFSSLGMQAVAGEVPATDSCVATGCIAKDAVLLQMSRIEPPRRALNTLAVLPDCCSNCVGSLWCSPGSGNCYETQGKNYYESCPVDPTPVPPTPPPTPVPPPTPGASITVVSYNLYWWNIRSNNRWSNLFDRIEKEAPFDLIGFQECENVRDVVHGSGLEGFDYYQGPNKPSNNPAPLAWNTAVFTKLAGPGEVWVASDGYGGRYMTWVRLQHKTTGVKIFFANTHGPLGNCGSTLGNNWANGVRNNKVEGDVVFVTGDYNCWTGTTAMNILKDSLVNDGEHDIDGGIDQIITDIGVKVSGGELEGWPSDHPLIKGTFLVGEIEPTPAPPPTPEPTCIAAAVRRRRRNEEMCACRRRSGPRDGFKCVGNEVVVDDVQ